MASFGKTRVLCRASFEKDVPKWMKGQGKGWLTAEYSLLPSSTRDRCPREATKGKQSGRTIEIQRLIGRSLRSGMDFIALGERSIKVDCDVLLADGGTRTCSISGAVLAVSSLLIEEGLSLCTVMPNLVSSVSAGICNGKIIVDLDYEQDSNADLDLNLVLNNKNEIIEIQGTAEGKTISRGLLNKILDQTEIAINCIRKNQITSLKETYPNIQLNWESS